MKYHFISNPSRHHVILNPSDLIISAIQEAIISKYDDFDEIKDSCIIDFFEPKAHCWGLYEVISDYAYFSCFAPGYHDYTKRINLDEQKFFCAIDKSNMDSYHKNQLKEAFKWTMKDTELRIELMAFFLSIGKITSATEEFLQKKYDENRKRYEED